MPLYKTPSACVTSICQLGTPFWIISDGLGGTELGKRRRCHAPVGRTLMCGSSETSGNHLSCIFPLLRCPGRIKGATRGNNDPRQRSLCRSQDASEWSGAVLAGKRRCKIKEDDDKVYAITNMIAPDLRPNHEESTAGIFYRTAVQLIVKDDLKGLGIYETQNQEELERLTSI